jgi:exosortase
VRTSDWLIVGMIGVVFAPAVLAMSEVWDRLGYYSHGYLVPLVALWIATAKRGLLARLPAERDRRGLLVLGLALALDLAGTLALIVWLQGLSVVLAVAGGVLFLRGIAWVRALSFPIGFLVFMVPLPDALAFPVIAKLQIFVSTAGVWILHSLGVAVFREGNVIQLPGGESLFVAEACSGVTSIFTLLSLSVFFAYFTERSLGRRAVLVASAVPIALLGNLLRVLAIVLASRSYGVEAATKGDIHDSAGIFIYVFACLALIGVGSLMRLVKPVESGQSAGSAAT